MAVITPLIHMNGTSAEELLNLREAFYAALQEAEQALKQMAPNGRDYYPTPGMMELAVEQHRLRMATLGGLMKQIETECENINQQTTR